MSRTLPRVLALVVVAGATIIGLLLLSDATKYRGLPQEGGQTRVVFTVETRRYVHGDDFAAQALWSACVGSVGWEHSTPPVPAARERYVATVKPGLAADARRRLRGCIEDATVDRIMGDVVSMPTTTNAEPTNGAGDSNDAESDPAPGRTG